MNRKELLLKMLPGILPILIFIAVDEIWGTEVGLWVAISFGVTELIYFWIKDKRFDKFVLFDTLLLVALGGVSLILENEAFFKIKPGIIGIIFCVLLGISAFSPRNFLFDMSKRYMKGIEFTDIQQKQFTRSLKVLFIIVSIHTLLVFYSVWFMSKEAWAFISGVLLYLMMAVWFVYEYLNQRLKQRNSGNQEWLPLVNEQGAIVGKALRDEVHQHTDWLHPVVHLHVFNEKGDWYLQKRPLIKIIQPGKWDTAVGGHISLGESVEIGLQREAFEELGIKDFKAEPVLQYIWKSEVESELVFCFATRYLQPIFPNKEELDGGRFWSLNEIKQSIGKGILTPNFEHEFQLLMQKSKIK